MTDAVDKKDVRTLFVNVEDGSIHRMISYSENPVFGFKDIVTDEGRHVAASSSKIRNFVRLVREDKSDRIGPNPLTESRTPLRFLEA